MKRIFQIFFFLFITNFFFTHNICAQYSDEDKYNYSNGDYLYNNYDYEQAVGFFLRLTTKYPDNSKFLYRAGMCYLNIKGEENKAVINLQLATKEIDNKYFAEVIKGTGAPPDVWLYLGEAYHKLNKFLEASEAYHKYLPYISQNEIARKDVIRRIQNLGISFDATIRPDECTLINIGFPINHPEYSEYNPVFSGDKNIMAYTSFRNQTDRIFITNCMDNSWSNPVDITESVDSKGDFFTTSISYDGHELYLVHYDPYNSDIFLSKLFDGSWSKMIALNKNINSKYIETGASVSTGGDSLFFSSNRTGGYGGFDIYLSVKVNGEWSKAINLGNSINTTGDEQAPIISVSGKTLFYNSNGRQGLGKSDIFWSEVDSAGNWMIPVNLGAPFNTPDDDISFWFFEKNQSGYLSRLMDDGSKRRDIFIVNCPGTENKSVCFQFENPNQNTSNNLQSINDRSINNKNNDENFLEPKDSLSYDKSQIGYTIQIMAYSKLSDAEIFLKIDRSKLKISIGNDGLKRYTYGQFNSFDEAATDLLKLKEIGFYDAFIRKIIEIENY